MTALNLDYYKKYNDKRLSNYVAFRCVDNICINILKIDYLKTRCLKY